MKQERYTYPGKVLVITEKSGILTFEIIHYENYINNKAATAGRYEGTK